MFSDFCFLLCFQYNNHLKFHNYTKYLGGIQPEKKNNAKEWNFAGKFVPESAVLEMKSNFKLPDDNDPLFDSIEYVELPKRDVQTLVER